MPDHDIIAEVVHPQESQHTHHLERVAPAVVLQHNRAEDSAEERAQMLARCYETERERPLCLDNTLRNEAGRARVVEALESAGQRAKDGYITQDNVFVIAENADVGHEKREDSPDAAGVEDDYVTAHFVA